MRGQYKIGRFYLICCFHLFKGAVIQNEPLGNDDDDDYASGYYSVKQEQRDPEVSMDIGDASYMGDSFGSFTDEYMGADEDDFERVEDTTTNYDDLVEESLLEVSMNIYVYIVV